MVPDFQRCRGDGPQTWKWMREEGIDLIVPGDGHPGDPCVVGFEMAAVKIDNDRFDTLDVNEAQRVLKKGEKEPQEGPGTIMSIKAGLPVTYAIRTRGGSIGVLQIEDARVSETPAVFRLRYKLFPKP